jgi:Protein of unknown function (DUF4235)
VADEDDAWKAMAAAAGVGAALAARKAVEEAWRRRRGSDPPRNPAGHDTTWGQAILWSVVSGVVIGLARLVAERAAAGVFARRAGHLPAAVEKRSD